MDFYYVIGAIVYIAVIVLIGASLPTTYFDQVRIDSHNFNAYTPYGSVNESAQAYTGVIKQTGFLLQMAKFLFVPIIITGLPFVLSLVIMIINYVVMSIPIIYVADYIRGR
jgi:hypothetical protein